MLEKDKLQIVCYVDVRGLNQDDTFKILTETAECVTKGNDGSVSYYFIATTEGNSRMECINPVIATEEQRKKIDEILNKLENMEGIVKK